MYAFLVPKNKNNFVSISIRVSSDLKKIRECTGPIPSNRERKTISNRRGELRTIAGTIIFNNHWKTFRTIYMCIYKEGKKSKQVGVPSSHYEKVLGTSRLCSDSAIYRGRKYKSHMAGFGGLNKSPLTCHTFFILGDLYLCRAIHFCNLLLHITIE